MKRVLLIATGGTIASVKTAHGLTPRLSPEVLRGSVPRIEEICEVDSIQLFNLDSTNMQPEHWLRIAETVEKNYEKYDGFVITHGTDTMSYTAAALTYLIQNPGKPVLLTGAQKPLNDPFTDARKNLADSFWLACQENVKGVFLVFGGQVIWGARAKKIKTKSYLAFDSINYPVAAFIDNQRMIRYTSLVAGEEKIRFSHTMVPSVFLLKLIPGMNPDILDYIGERYKAVVIESYGAGGLPFVEQGNFLEKLEKLTQKGCIIVIATQVMLEGSDVQLYEVGCKAMEKYNLLQTYDMSVEAVVTKLMWLLGESGSFREIRQKFYRTIAHDILHGE